MCKRVCMCELAHSFEVCPPLYVCFVCMCVCLVSRACMYACARVCVCVYVCVNV